MPQKKIWLKLQMPWRYALYPCGTILKHGLQDKIADVVEIQRSNMSKLQ